MVMGWLQALLTLPALWRRLLRCSCRRWRNLRCFTCRRARAGQCGCWHIAVETLPKCCKGFQMGAARGFVAMATEPEQMVATEAVMPAMIPILVGTRRTGRCCWTRKQRCSDRAECCLSRHEFNVGVGPGAPFIKGAVFHEISRSYCSTVPSLFGNPFPLFFRSKSFYFLISRYLQPF